MIQQEANQNERDKEKNWRHKQTKINRYRDLLL